MVRGEGGADMLVGVWRSQLPLGLSPFMNLARSKTENATSRFHCHKLNTPGQNPFHSSTRLSENLDDDCLDWSQNSTLFHVLGGNADRLQVRLFGQFSQVRVTYSCNAYPHD